uniref:Senescence regulator S40 n=1 Tax=Salix viminalis TaxID=40686 RepID=A0A6N2LCJ8_SALVM
MADWCGVTGKGRSAGGGYGRRSMRDGDFEEEDVWSVMKEVGDSSSNSKYPSSGSSFSSAWHLPGTAPRMIPPAKPTASNHGGKVQSSAPVNIPDWSKIYGKDSRGILGSWVDDQNGTAYGDGDGHVNGEVNDNDYEEDDIVPPHEWLARKLARSQISSFSVCEGVGRTLKGRDLSKVRNAILTKTGFLE